MAPLNSDHVGESGSSPARLTHRSDGASHRRRFPWRLALHFIILVQVILDLVSYAIDHKIK